VTVTLSGTASADLMTDGDGVFQFHGLAAGDYTLTLRLTDYSTVTTLTGLSSGDRIDFGDLILLKHLAGSTTGTIRGTVTSAETHTPLGGVVVTAGSYTAVTGSDGSYQISNVTAGQITVAAHLDGYTSLSRSSTEYDSELHGGALRYRHQCRQRRAVAEGYRQRHRKYHRVCAD
jgi:hypothetical protein